MNILKVSACPDDRTQNIFQKGFSAKMLEAQKPFK